MVIMFSPLNTISKIRNKLKKERKSVILYLPFLPQILLKKARKITSIATPANDPMIMANVF